MESAPEAIGMDLMRWSRRLREKIGEMMRAEMQSGVACSHSSDHVQRSIYDSLDLFHQPSAIDEQTQHRRSDTCCSTMIDNFHFTRDRRTSTIVIRNIARAFAIFARHTINDGDNLFRVSLWRRYAY